MDELIIPFLYIYGIMLGLAVIKPPQKYLWAVLVGIFSIRLFCVGMRISLGSDLQSYIAILSKCDLSSINAQELFWHYACQPSTYLSTLFPFPFFWIGLFDCILFALIAHLGGLRIAALHDLIYLPSASMGAIRQALAMKIILAAVLLYASHHRKQNLLAYLGVLGTPLVHLASFVPAAMIQFMRSGVVMRVVLIAAVLLVGYILVDEALLSKLMFYLEFEGFRSAQDIYLSWIKRVLIILSSLTLTISNNIYWQFYSIGLVLAAAEFQVPEIAVRLGAYFEQFEVLLISAPIKPHLRRIGIAWYVLIAVAYTSRYMINIGLLNR